MSSVSSQFRFDPTSGEIVGRGKLIRRLSDLNGVFADQVAYRNALQAGNPILYHTSQVEDGTGEGDLHFALGVIMPGKIGDEYYMTRGHLHAWRPAAEVYIGISGRGMMLLEGEETGVCSAVSLEANSIVYVPGATAHRTVNIGDAPLVYWGILASRAGHDYGAVAQRNFSKVVIERNGTPTVLDRSDYLTQLQQASNCE